MSDSLPLIPTLEALPPIWPEDVLPLIREAICQSGRKVVILDDDPTGTQTVRDLPVITQWDEASLRAEFSSAGAGFFILTNSRGLTPEETIKLHRTIATNLDAVAGDQPFTLISRSDSTLRGHYPIETDVLNEVLGPYDLTVIVPFFEAGGRFTIHHQHYVVEGESLVPADRTPFASDAVFGYGTSDLPAWVEEKSGGRVQAADVICISLAMLRAGGPSRVTQVLDAAPEGSVCVVDAVTNRDVEVFAAGALVAEEQGRRMIYRTAASFVSARVGQSPAPCLPGTDVAHDTSVGGLIVAGSYVPKTSAQLTRLRERHDVVALEIEVSAVLDPARRNGHVMQLVADMNQALAAGRHVLVYTSRVTVTGDNAAANLAIGQTVSRTLVEIVQKISARPRFLIAKGGITSSDVATEGLGVYRAVIMGQLLPGVPIWRLGRESKYPNLSYVVFPGNVGSIDALAEAFDRLTVPSKSA